MIAAVDGYALGGGNELQMACAYRVASRAPSSGQPEINLHVHPRLRRHPDAAAAGRAPGARGRRPDVHAARRRAGRAARRPPAVRRRARWRSASSTRWRPRTRCRTRSASPVASRSASSRARSGRRSPTSGTLAFPERRARRRDPAPARPPRAGPARRARPRHPRRSCALGLTQGLEAGLALEARRVRPRWSPREDGRAGIDRFLARRSLPLPRAARRSVPAPMRWLLDGYNVIRRDPDLTRREARAAWRRAAPRSCTWWRAVARTGADDFTVVFDGARRGGGAPAGGQVQVIFSRPAGDRRRRAAPARRRLRAGGVVVTSDRTVRDAGAARRRGDRHRRGVPRRRRGPRRRRTMAEGRRARTTTSRRRRGGPAPAPVARGACDRARCSAGCDLVDAPGANRLEEPVTQHLFIVSRQPDLYSHLTRSSPPSPTSP